MDNVQILPTASIRFVYGEYLAAGWISRHPDLRPLDVQPPEPLELWKPGFRAYPAVEIACTGRALRI